MSKWKDQFVQKKNELIFPTINDLVPNCTCKKCATKNCLCRAYGIPCISFCQCKKDKTCKNTN